MDSVTRSNTPALRFDGFDGEWPQSRLSDHLILSENTNANREFGREDVYAVSLEEGLVNQIKFHGRSFAGKSLENYDVIHAGEVVYTKSPLKFTPYGIFKSHFGETGIVSPLYAVYQTKPHADARFVQDYFALPERLNSYLSPLVNKGAKNTMNISDWNALCGAVTFPPTLHEQRAIGEFFSHLDALIEQHRAKHANLQQTKSALLQRMFPQDGTDEPELRLGGFSGAWATKKVDEICPLQRGFDLPASEMVEGPVPVVTSNGVARRHNKALVKGPGVTTGRSGTIGKVHFVEQDYWPHNTALWVTDFKGNDPRFVYHLLQHIDPSRFSSGSGVPTLNRNDLHDFVTFIPPALEEQRAIGEVFSNLDALITAEHRYITQLTQAKTALLQRMFV